MVEKSLDRKLAAIHADPHGCREFLLADAKDADMGLGIGAPGHSPEAHTGEVRCRTLEEYRAESARTPGKGCSISCSCRRVRIISSRSRSISSTARPSHPPSARTTRPTSIWPGARFMRKRRRGRTARPFSMRSSAAISTVRRKNASWARIWVCTASRSTTMSSTTCRRSNTSAPSGPRPSARGFATSSKSSARMCPRRSLPKRCRAISTT